MHQLKSPIIHNSRNSVNTLHLLLAKPKNMQDTQHTSLLTLDSRVPRTYFISHLQMLKEFRICTADTDIRATAADKKRAKLPGLRALLADLVGRLREQPECGVSHVLGGGIGGLGRGTGVSGAAEAAGGEGVREGGRRRDQGGDIPLVVVGERDGDGERDEDEEKGEDGGEAHLGSVVVWLWLWL
jgi:hypothetical protein